MQHIIIISDDAQNQCRVHVSVFSVSGSYQSVVHWSAFSASGSYQSALFLSRKPFPDRSVKLLHSRMAELGTCANKVHEMWVGFFLICILFYTLNYPFREIRTVLPGYGYTDQPQEQRYPAVLQVYAGSVRVSVIHQTLTWTTGALCMNRDNDRSL